MRRALVVAALAVVVAGVAVSAWAVVPPDDGHPGAVTLAQLDATLDQLLALERREGGWTFAAEGRARPQPMTAPLKFAERIAAPLGLADWDLVVLRSPGTPAAALALLDGYERTGRERYLAGAVRAGDLLLHLQMPSGGWFSEMPVEGDHVAPWFRIVHRTTLDDDVTTGATRVLLSLWRVTGAPRFRAGAERALELLRAAQLPSGAWPLVWRPWWKRAIWPTFEDLATINDDTTPAAIETLLLGADLLGRDDLREAARRGGEWLLVAQRATPSGAWAQQYDADGRPAQARRFEPPALASWESRYAVEALVALANATGDQRYCAATARALEWLAASALRPGCWARFYGLDSNRPIYIGPDGVPVSQAADARLGYDWTGDYGISTLLDRFGDARDRAAAGVHVTGAVALDRPVNIVPGDPGTCPDESPHGYERLAPEDPRAVIARAAILRGALDGPSPSTCALAADQPRNMSIAAATRHKPAPR
ncbi:MAG TPA: pectate lyase [Candidatus Binatia bacterium]|jgi:hypothetical protein